MYQNTLGDGQDGRMDGRKKVGPAPERTPKGVGGHEGGSVGLSIDDDDGDLTQGAPSQDEEDHPRVIYKQVPTHFLRSSGGSISIPLAPRFIKY